jgi:hypothetical protein
MSAIASGAGERMLPARFVPLPAEARRQDAFPHTRRRLPWMLAGFLALLFLVPIDSTHLKIHLPVDSHIDRFAILAIVAAWFWLGGDQRTFFNPRRSKLFITFAALFTAATIASVVLDGPRIINLSELTLAEKHLATLAAFLVVGWFTLTAVRRADLPGLASYLIGLGCLTALGVLIERRTGYNVFYNFSEMILKPIATVAPAPTNIHPAFGTDGRAVVVGPTIHGLAVTALMTMVMPFALVRMLDAKERKPRLMYAAAFLLMLAGAIATDKKTAVVVPFAIVAYVTFYRPRQMMKIVPIGLIVLVGIVHFASPGALGSIFDKKQAVNSNSTLHRLGDFSSVVPDILAHPVIGRGFGTLNPDQPTIFRINDDEYVDEIWQVGIVGLLAYVGMIIAPILVARRAIRGRDPAMCSLALATSAGCVAYLVVSALLDAMSFPQAPYMFFVVAALATVASSKGEDDDEDAPRARSPRRPGRARRARSYATAEMS